MFLFIPSFVPYLVPKLVPYFVPFLFLILKSNEELQAKFEALNTRLHAEAFDDTKPKDERKLVPGSLYFKAMYPSLKVEATTEIVRRRVEKSEIDVVVDDEELSKILFTALTETEIKDEEIQPRWVKLNQR